ncbi:MAG: type II secretion system protein GspM [Candidatus Dadabacteria bacterium]|nr:type II secretion system protein GspM [Candidatus Dadabacteria bacterium]MCZ6685337.1 type II secretion system protein GspM [Candidatus Dadabacteria bacterium]MCZ6791793.1 type II secretion system protein GspM [Candidatus Dadabacteria bacterium]
MDIDSIRQKIQELIEKSREKFYSLTSTERDRRALLLGGSAIVIIVIYLVFHSYSSGTDHLQKRFAQLEKELREVKVLKAEYEDSNKKIVELSSKIKKENEALISVVEKILLNEKLDRTNFSIRDVNSRTNSNEDFYEEKSVDVELNKISLSNLVDILYKLQNKPSLKVSNVNISTKLGKSDSINVKLRVSTYEFKQVS